MTKTFNWQIVIRTFGALVVLLSLFMLVPTILAYIDDSPDAAAFAVSTVITFLSGLVAELWSRRAPHRVGEREGYLIVALIWVVFSIFGLQPFYYSGALSTITDAWFETMAGFTTFGGTVFKDVEIQSRAILLWRSMMQWLGGLGIIVLSIAILPLFGLGGMQLYAAEVTGVSYEKLSPRIADTAKSMWGTYLLLTISEAVLLGVAGMPTFDSICHAMTTVATGGFSTRNDSLMGYGPLVQYIVLAFMVLAGINFTQLIYVMRGNPLHAYRDEETRWYLGAVLCASVVLSLGLFVYYGFFDPESTLSLDFKSISEYGERAIRHGFFTAVATITSTGFSSTDYMLWPPLLWLFVLLFMFSGGSSGSTAGGIKWVRIAIVAKNAYAEMYRRIHPNAIIPIRFNGQPLPRSVVNNVMAFLFFYIIIIAGTVVVFIACGISLDESFGAAVSGIGNIGAAVGNYGPSGTYTDFPTFAKWWMTIVMLIGRLEIFTVLLLFNPVLWKK